jgi:hypothetical protein
VSTGTLSTNARYNGFASLGDDIASSDHFVSKTEAEAREPFQRALPLPLCSTDVNVIGDDYVAFDYYAGDGGYGAGSGGTTATAFTVPDCAHYFATSGTQRKATVNGVRVMNAAVLSDAILPNGLSIVTNLPMYVLGDLNTSSTPADSPGAYNAGWVPVMIGGDTVSILSNNWEDDETPWNVPVRTYWRLRDATHTTYHSTFLFGWAESDSAGCRDEFTYSLRLQEHWDRGASVPVSRTIRGSLFIAFNNVYGSGFSDVHHYDYGGSWHDGNSAQKLYLYDYHLETLSNQPPGAPTYTVNAVRSWRRD